MLLFGASSATALTLGFSCISNNVAGDCTIGQAQLQVTSSAGPGANQVSFTFTNSGPDDASITDIYFDDDAGALLAIASFIETGDVDFGVNASPPGLPAGNNASPAFDDTGGISADSDPPVQPNGVNPTESLTIIADLAAGISFADVEAALANGSLRIGIHVQGFQTGGSESFVSTVPEPSAALLLAAPLLGLWLRSRKR